MEHVTSVLNFENKNYKNVSGSPFGKKTCRTFIRFPRHKDQTCIPIVIIALLKQKADIYRQLNSIKGLFYSEEQAVRFYVGRNNVHAFASKALYIAYACTT